MTTRKGRKPLDDALASEFVYGTPQSKMEPMSSLPEPELTPELPKSSSPKANSQPQTSLMSKLLATPDKEATIRLTADLPESMHRKLSILCARTGKKKVEVVRMLLAEALEGIED